MDNVFLTRKEESALRHLETVDVLPDSVLDEEPYARLARLELVERCSSDLFPPPKNYSEPGFKTHFLYNAIRVSDKGKSYLAERDKEKREFPKTALVSIGSAIIGSLVTLLVTNISSILATLQELIQGA